MASIPVAIDTPKEALTYILSLPQLRFGNAGIIDALKLLRGAEELIERAESIKCSDCNGTGEDDSGHCDCCGEKCIYCGGECLTCDGEGEIKLTREEVYTWDAERIYTRLFQMRGPAAA